MTGFGKSAATVGGKTFTVEVRSLNSKYLDLNLKIPAMLKDREIDFRNLLSEEVIRGKTELVIEIQQGGEGAFSINRNAFRQYYSQLESLAEELDATAENLFNTVLTIPGVLSESGDDISDSDYSGLEKIIRQAIGKFDAFRLQEGKQMENDMVKRVQQIKKINAEIKKTEGKRKTEIRNKLKQRLSELVKSREVDEVRLEQELVLHAERLDITEEMVRLESHCNYFLEVVKDKEKSKGKKLTFISQEIGREINTLGSKSYDATLQKLAVQLKEELEKIKEQVNNVL